MGDTTTSANTSATDASPPLSTATAPAPAHSGAPTPTPFPSDLPPVFQSGAPTPTPFPSDFQSGAPTPTPFPSDIAPPSNNNPAPVSAPSTSASTTEENKSNTQQEWTKETLIAHLLRPGYKYLNLNPYSVLQIPFTATDEDIKKAYRNMSRFVHPDKNKDDLERSQQAFEAVNTAHKMLTDEEVGPRCKQVIEEARRRLNDQRDLARSKEPVTDTAIMNEASKVFAEIEKKRVQLEERDAQEKKRKREQELVSEEKRKKEKEYEENWEKNRDTRVNSWRNFAQKGKKVGSGGGVKPPKLKQTK